MINWAELTLFLYIMARMSGFVLFNPILGRRDIPARFRSGLILLLAVTMYAMLDQTVEVPATTVEFMVCLLVEMALGFFLGMVVSFFFYIPQLAGSVADSQMGMSMNQTYDPTSQDQTTVTGLLLNVFMTLLFFVANGHHTLLRIFLTSGEVVPLGAVALGESAAAAMLELFVACTLLGVKMAMPILVAELMGQVGMGILMKVIPQINVFVINIDLKVLIGLILLILLMAPFGEFLLQAEATMLNGMRDILALAGG